MLQQHIDQHRDSRLLTVGAEGNAEEEVRLLLEQIGGNETAIDAFGVLDIQAGGEFGLEDLEEISQMDRIFEQLSR
jgi:hypothetical protein